MSEIDVVKIIESVEDMKKLFTLCGIFIFTDILTGYLNAIKFKNINSSISRDGYIKKLGWILSLVLGWSIDFFIGVNLFAYGSAIVCLGTEAISVYENLGKIGVKLPFAKYFEKIKDGVK